MTRRATRNSGSSDPLAAVFADRLHEAQREAGLKNEELARELEVSLRLVQKWRSGSVRPGGANLVKLARVLDREVGWFFTATEAVA